MILKYFSSLINNIGTTEVVNQSEYLEHSLVSWLRAERDVHGLSRRLYSQESAGGVSVALLYSRSRPGVIGGAGTRLVAIYFWSNSVSGSRETSKLRQKAPSPRIYYQSLQEYLSDVTLL